MKKIVGLFSIALACAGLVSCGESSDKPINPTPPVEDLPQEDDKVHLVILTGQSGARGKALNNSLTPEQKETNYDVDICADGLMMQGLGNIPTSLSNSAYLNELKPGFGDTASEFGPELGMGETLASRYPKDGDARKSVIVKYTACGSTFTDHWYSNSAIEDDSISSSLELKQIREDKNGKATGPLTNNLYQLIDSTIEQLNSEGYEVVIDGAAFVHGEQDAKFDSNMAIYEKMLSYFIKDLRDYVGNQELPFVVTEALTNSAKYSNELRSIQKKVAAETSNCSFISSTDLYTNTFEPWHFGTESNYVLGNRIAAEIISLNDTRKVKSFDDTVVQVPAGVNITLPTYLKASFENNYSGYVKVNYNGSYDSSKLGEQEVEFTAKTGIGTLTSKLKVNVTNEPYVDGIIDEPLYETAGGKHVVDGIGTIYVVKGATGLYISAKITDKELWTDGESWAQGDMGQNGANDDFRIYVTGSTASERTTICLSSANLLRVYESGATGFIPNFNLYYGNYLENFKYHVTTFGYTNDNGKKTSNGMELELFISYEDLGIDNPDNIKMCFNYNDISYVNNKKTAKDNYYCKKEASIDKPEENDEYYFTLSEILNCNCEG